MLWKEAAVPLLCSKKSKLEEVFFRSACYAIQEAWLDFSQARPITPMLRQEVTRHYLGGVEPMRKLIVLA